MVKPSRQSPVDSQQILARYIGNGAFFDGVPTRDLTRAEWDALTDELRAAIRASKLYEFVESQTNVKE